VELDTLKTGALPKLKIGNSIMNFIPGKLYRTKAPITLNKRESSRYGIYRDGLSISAGTIVMFLKEETYSEEWTTGSGTPISSPRYTSWWLVAGLDRRVEIPWSTYGVKYFKNHYFSEEI